MVAAVLKLMSKVEEQHPDKVAVSWFGINIPLK